MQALAQTTEDDCYTRAANDDCFYGGPGTRTKFAYDPVGRQVTDTVSGVAKAYLYDGWNPATVNRNNSDLRRWPRRRFRSCWQLSSEYLD